MIKPFSGKMGREELFRRLEGLELSQTHPFV